MYTHKNKSNLILSSVCFVTLSLMADPTSPTKGTSSMSTTPMAKIAIVDYRQILSQDPQLLKEGTLVSREWKKAYTAIQETLKPVQAEIASLRSQYEAKKKELEALQKSGVSSKEALQKKYGEEVAPLEYRLQAHFEQAQNYHYNEVAKIQNSLLPKIQKATDEMVKKGGWDFALDKGAVLSTISAGSRFNITADVLSSLNAQFDKDEAAKKKKDSKPAKAA